MNLEEAIEERERARNYWERVARRYYETIGFGTHAEITKASQRVTSAMRTLIKAQKRVARLLQKQESKKG